MLGMEGFSGEGRESNPGPEPKTSDLTPTETHLAGLLFQDALFEPSLPTGPMPERNPPTDKTLQEIRTDLGDCTRCKLSETRTQIVFGEGNPSARLVFVGEAPGAEEDAQGRPFVGRAGQLLTRMIEAMGMRREDVYICNVIKCRPPENDFSLAIRVGAVAACEGFLHRQLMVIKPKAIVALGNPAVQALLKTKEGITKLRGNWQTYQNVPVMPTYHPAFLLRSPDRKKEVWEDLQKVMALLAEG
ncbi:MAG: uracil-DNA glycosylase [Acidobacteria bacterium]|nr:uracil-DNA glycosylase [Acidobacteriota bacterium]